MPCTTKDHLPTAISLVLYGSATQFFAAQELGRRQRILCSTILNASGFTQRLVSGDSTTNDAKYSRMFRARHIPIPV